MITSRLARGIINSMAANRSLIKLNKFTFTEDNLAAKRFIVMDANYLSQIPFFFKPLEPFIMAIKDTMISVNGMIGLPWWAVLMLSSFIIRLSIFPLMLVQMKRMSKIAPVSPVLVLLKDVWKYSDLPFWGKLKSTISVYRALCKQEGFRMSTVFVYNLAYYPFIISMVFGLRQLLAVPEVGESGFLWMTSLIDIDPSLVLPTITILLYYYNFQRDITPENKNTIITKIRRLCQVFLICWYPFLCSWPAGITIYMCCNAIFSVLQSSLMKTPWFMLKINQKIMLYNQMLRTVEYDKSISEGLIKAIQKGQENEGVKGIKEDKLMEQVQTMLKNLEKGEKQQEEEQEQKEKESPKKMVSSKK